MIIIKKCDFKIFLDFHQQKNQKIKTTTLNVCNYYLNSTALKQYLEGRFFISIILTK